MNTHTGEKRGYLYSPTGTQSLIASSQLTFVLLRGAVEVSAYRVTCVGTHASTRERWTPRAILMRKAMMPASLLQDPVARRTAGGEAARLLSGTILHDEFS